MGIMAVAACCNENINIIYEKKMLKLLSFRCSRINTPTVKKVKDAATGRAQVCRE